MSDQSSNNQNSTPSEESAPETDTASKQSQSVPTIALPQENLSVDQNASQAPQSDSTPKSDTISEKSDPSEPPKVQKLSTHTEGSLLSSRTPRTQSGEGTPHESTSTADRSGMPITARASDASGPSATMDASGRGGEQDDFAGLVDYEEDEGDEDEPEPLVAVPYSTTAPRDEEVTLEEVSSSPAFQCLDELHREGRITGTEVAALKAKYRELHQSLLESKENESSLIKRAKKYQSTLEQQRAALEEADTFPENVNTSDTAKMREQLLRANNQLSEIEERRYEQEYKLESMKEERTIKQREYDRIPKASEFEKHLKLLQDSCEELRLEIHQRDSEKRSLKEDLEKATGSLGAMMHQVEESTGRYDNLKAELVAQSGIPTQLSKDAEKVMRYRAEVLTELKDAEDQLRALSDQLNSIGLSSNIVEREHFELGGELERLFGIRENKQRDIDEVNRQMDVAKEREAMLATDRASVELSLKHVNAERREEHREQSKRMRSKEEDLRRLKRADGMARHAKDSLESSKAMLDKTKGSVEFEKQAYLEQNLAAQRKLLERELQETKQYLDNKDLISGNEARKLKQCLDDESRLSVQLNELRINVIELVRIAAIKTEEREQKSRDFVRADHRAKRTKEDLRLKDLAISEHRKKLEEMQNRLRDFAKLYDVIKNERNKCVSAIQLAQQKSAEMRERLKILQNELEILRTGATHKDAELKAVQMKHQGLVVERDVARNEQSKQRFILSELRSKHEQQMLENSRLNGVISQGEEQMVQFRKKYELAVQAKNERSVQLVEREEEVCVLQEKVHIQEGLIKAAQLELEAREEELAMLRRALSEEARQIVVMRKRVPQQKQLADEVTSLQIQVSQCQDRALELEKEVQDPKHGGGARITILTGQTQSASQLQEKIENLETQLADRERQILERTLVLEEVERLVSRTQERHEANSDDTLKLAQSVNQTQRNMKSTTRKLAANLAELAMRQADVRALQLALQGKERELEAAYANLNSGLPPDPTTEHAWQTRQAIERMRVEEKQLAVETREAEELRRLPDGSLTSAEPRPNAYIPEDETQLPVPRPYGAHAPFKPQSTGAGMRHFRKPIPKPIEI